MIFGKRVENATFWVWRATDVTKNATRAAFFATSGREKGWWHGRGLWDESGFGEGGGVAGPHAAQVKV